MTEAVSPIDKLLLTAVDDVRFLEGGLTARPSRQRRAINRAARTGS